MEIYRGGGAQIDPPPSRLSWDPGTSALIWLKESKYFPRNDKYQLIKNWKLENKKLLFHYKI